MPPPARIDVLRQFRADYVAPRQPVRLMIAPACYLVIRGRGQPGDDAFVAQIGALYAVAFTTKMQRKFAGKGDYTVSKLEARWPDFAAGGPPSHAWELMIRTPDCVRADDLTAAQATLRARGQPTEVNAVELTTLAEGECVQVLHVGPYDQEPQSLALLTAFAAGRGCKPSGPHHEIYLSDPRRVPAERLRTILRLPVRAEPVVAQLRSRSEPNSGSNRRR